MGQLGERACAASRQDSYSPRQPELTALHGTPRAHWLDGVCRILDELRACGHTEVMCRSRGVIALIWSVLVSCGASSPRPTTSDPQPAQAAHAPVAKAAAEPSIAAAPAATDALMEYAASESASASAMEASYPLYGVAFHVYAHVFSEPSARGVPIGHLRRGTPFRASLRRDGDGCAHGWHELAAGGFVCTGNGVQIGRGVQSFSPSPEPPALSDALPYRYAKNNAHSALQYWRIPTAQEQAAAAKVVADFAAAQAATAAAKPPVSDPATGEPPAEGPVLPDFARMVMEPGFYVSIAEPSGEAASSEPSGEAASSEPSGEAESSEPSGEAESSEPSGEAASSEPSGEAAPSEGMRGFARTVRGAYVETTGLSDVRLLIGAPGVVLGPGRELPLGIVYRGAAKTFRRDVASGELRSSEPLPKFSAIGLTGAEVANGNRRLRVGRGGLLVGDGNLRIATRALRPAIVPRHARLLHVNLAQQTLVAYDGERPVFATLVSTGKEGYETPAGAYRIQHKNVTATMDGLAGSDEAYSIEDVPWTMYFHGSYALHGAFWHDRFGQTRSHGCVNLAPADARWLFRWVTPSLPSGYHGVFSTRSDPGTFVWIE